MTGSTIEFKSPIHKLLASARLGRGKWKRKCMRSRRVVKELTLNLANARTSRQRWRSEASQLRQQVRALEGEVERLKMFSN